MLIRSELFKRKLRFSKNVKNLPGRPDIVFPNAKVAVFIDGDFWHGYRFPVWKDKVPDLWKEKINKNRKRDQRNLRMLRKMGWQVIRIWQHEIKRNTDSCIKRILHELSRNKKDNFKKI
jgi:DNA mismatch endonuclease (patch repair protein)